MGFIGWIIGFFALLGGLALRQDMPVGGGETLSNMLFALAVLSCPMLWRDNLFGISRGQRVACGLALIFCLPMILLPSA